MNRVETHLTWGILMGLALLCVGIFFCTTVSCCLLTPSQIFS
jgi:hypothetical protein